MDKDINRAINVVFNPKGAFFHYSSIAKNAMDKSANGVKVLKRQLYALRCICAALWIRNNGTVPPIDVTNLFAEELPNEFVYEVLDIIDRRKRGEDVEDHWFSQPIRTWIYEQIDTLRENPPDKATKAQVAEAELLFFSTLWRFRA